MTKRKIEIVNKFYSPKLNRYFDSQEELEKAVIELEEKEQKQKQLAETRKARAQEVNDAYKHADALLREFVKDYGYYHTSHTSPTSFSISRVIDTFFDNWFN